jgi:hypothetical protein
MPVLKGTVVGDRNVRLKRGRIPGLITFAFSLSGDLRKRPCAQRSDANTYHGDALPSELRGRAGQAL